MILGKSPLGMALWSSGQGLYFSAVRLRAKDTVSLWFVEQRLMVKIARDRPVVRRDGKAGGL